MGQILAQARIRKHKYAKIKTKSTVRFSFQLEVYEPTLVHGVLETLTTFQSSILDCFALELLS